MITERYIVNFYSVGDKRFNLAEVKETWIHAADVYKRQASNFVNGLVLYVDGGILAYIGKQPK